MTEVCMKCGNIITDYIFFDSNGHEICESCNFDNTVGKTEYQAELELESRYFDKLDPNNP